MIHHNAAYYAQGWIDGKQNFVENLNIQYNYHIHEGTPNIIANGCYKTPVYHSHTTNCYRYCSGVWVFVKRDENEHGVTQDFYRCSNGCSIGYVGSPYKNGSGSGNPCSNRSLSCSLSGTIETHTFGCGKTDSTIESAIIIY